MRIQHFKKRNSGFTLLFASLVVSLILSVGLAVASITLTQLTLSSAGRESQFAFYNADSGIECALHYEYNVPRDDDTPFFSSTDDSPPDNSIECAGQTIVIDTNDVSRPDSNPNSTTTTTFFVNQPGASCEKDEPSFQVKVQKSPSIQYPGATNVKIDSRGYNTCDETNPRRVERGLFVTFID